MSLRPLFDCRCVRLVPLERSGGGRCFLADPTTDAAATHTAVSSGWPSRSRTPHPADGSRSPATSGTALQRAYRRSVRVLDPPLRDLQRASTSARPRRRRDTALPLASGDGGARRRLDAESGAGRTAIPVWRSATAPVRSGGRDRARAPIAARAGGALPAGDSCAVRTAQRRATTVCGAHVWQRAPRDRVRVAAREGRRSRSWRDRGRPGWERHSSGSIRMPPAIGPGATYFPPRALHATSRESGGVIIFMRPSCSVRSGTPRWRAVSRSE